MCEEGSESRFGSEEGLNIFRSLSTRESILYETQTKGWNSNASVIILKIPYTSNCKAIMVMQWTIYASCVGQQKYISIIDHISMRDYVFVDF